MFKPSDEFFKFPIRVYDHNYDQEGAEEYLKLHGYRPKREYIIGYVRVRIKDILSWEDTYSIYTPIEEVKEKGSMLTLVTTKDNEFFCSWTRERFEEAYNMFVDGYKDYIEEEIKKETQELSAATLTPEIAQSLEKILKEYKKQQKENKDGQQIAEGTV